MSKYLVLKMDFSSVTPDGNVEINFCDYINTECRAFSNKYSDAGLLKRPVIINPTNSLDTLNSLFRVVESSDQEVYLIVDECDSFVNKLILRIDTTKSDLRLKDYEDFISSKESMLRN